MQCRTAFFLNCHQCRYRVVSIVRKDHCGTTRNASKCSQYHAKTVVQRHRDAKGIISRESHSLCCSHGVIEYIHMTECCPLPQLLRNTDINSKVGHQFTVDKFEIISIPLLGEGLIISRRRYLLGLYGDNRVVLSTHRECFVRISRSASFVTSCFCWLQDYQTCAPLKRRRLAPFLNVRPHELPGHLPHMKRYRLDACHCHKEPVPGPGFHDRSTQELA